MKMRRTCSGILLCLAGSVSSFAPSRVLRIYHNLQGPKKNGVLVVQAGGNDWDSSSGDSNQWQSSSSSSSSSSTDGASGDWEETLSNKQDGSFWSSFEPSSEDDENSGVEGGSNKKTGSVVSEEDAADAWLDTLAELSNEEVEFNLQEAERADKARQMEEWGFDSKTITNALGVATDTALEDVDEVKGMQTYREESYLEEIDLETVESHTMLERDENGDSVRSQMVYVDEHTCIGCTNCAMIAQSTFFMHPEHGRARVFSQWGDDEETIAVAIQTCPVDCIHYVEVNELERLEVERRDQNINFKARLVSQAEGGGNESHLVGGVARFTPPQQITSSAKSRCNNCPSRGCAGCPMYGVGLNPNFEAKEKVRKARMAKKRLQQQRKDDQKTAEL